MEFLKEKLLWFGDSICFIETNCFHCMSKESKSDLKEVKKMLAELEQDVCYLITRVVLPLKEFWEKLTKVNEKL